MRNHTSVFHYIERRIIIIHERVRRAPPAGIPTHIVVVVADDTIRANVVRIVDVVAEVRRANFNFFLVQMLSRRNSTHFRLHNYPLLLQYTSHLWNNWDQLCPESARRNHPHADSNFRRLRHNQHEMRIYRLEYPESFTKNIGSGFLRYLYSFYR